MATVVEPREAAAPWQLETAAVAAAVAVAASAVVAAEEEAAEEEAAAAAAAAQPLLQLFHKWDVLRRRDGPHECDEAQLEGLRPQAPQRPRGGGARRQPAWVATAVAACVPRRRRMHLTMQMAPVWAVTAAAAAALSLRLRGLVPLPMPAPMLGALMAAPAPVPVPVAVPVPVPAPVAVAVRPVARMKAVEGAAAAAVVVAAAAEGASAPTWRFGAVAAGRPRTPLGGGTAVRPQGRVSPS